MHRDWTLWQIVDSAFPTGGFAHSNGLETAKQAGQVRDEDDLVEFSQVVLQQAADTVLPYVECVYQTPESLTTADAHCDAFLVNPVANRASRAQGNGLIVAATSAFPGEALAQFKRTARREQWPSHVAPLYGAIFRQLEIPLSDIRRSVLYVTVRTVLSAAIRLNIVGPLRSQALQQELAPYAEHLLQRRVVTDYRRVTQSAPVLDVWQSSHDRLYSRLFHS